MGPVKPKTYFVLLSRGHILEEAKKIINEARGGSGRLHVENLLCEQMRGDGRSARGAGQK